MNTARKLILATLVSLCAPIGLLALPSAALAEACPNEALRTGPSAHLPDCRAYELVTPADTQSGAFNWEGMGPGAGGTDDMLAESFAAIDGLKDDAPAHGGWYSVTRTESGWVTEPLPPSATEYEAVQPNGFASPILAESLDERSALWLEHGDSHPDDRLDWYVSRPGGAVEDVGPATPPGLTAPGAKGYSQLSEEDGVEPAGVSDDLSHILFTVTNNLWPGNDAEEGAGDSSLYEYVGVGNSVPMLVGVDESGNVISKCGTVLGAPRGVEEGGEQKHNAMSGDGNTIFFTAKACGGSPAVNELYARIDNGEPDAHTVAISEPSKADCSACETFEGEPKDRSPAQFLGASEDGSKVFFTTTQPLLGGDTSENIYEYDFDAPAGERIVRVSGGDSSVSAPTAEVEGVVQSAEDGSHVYFVAKGILTRTANSQGQVAQAGANNLYMFERDAQYPAGRTAFIADLSNSDQEQLWELKFYDTAHWADLTPDGDFMVFASSTDHLTPDDTSTAPQVFEYDAETGALVRVSIGEDGYNDNGNTDFTGNFDNNVNERPLGYAIESGQVFEPASYWSGLSVSADGSYVFFQSTDALTPEALDNVQTFDGPDYAVNIYEYHDGNVNLISDGHDANATCCDPVVRFLGSDASGDDVFFTTADQLVPQDTDITENIYDARVDGGFPAPVVAPECSGDACQGPLSPAPTLLAPGSEFQAGEVAPLATPLPVATPKPAAKKKAKPKKCKKGATLKQDRCVKQKARKSSRDGRAGS